MRTPIFILSFFLVLSAFVLNTASAQWDMQMPPPPVEVTVAVRAPLQQAITAVGSLAANEGAMLRPEIDGQITKILFEEGQAVKAGAELIKLDQSIQTAEAKRAQSSAALGGANLKRAEELKKAGYATQRSLDEARTEATSNSSEAAVARVRLDKTIIRAPFDGLAGFRQVSLGDYVRAGDAVLNIEQVDPIKVTFQVPEVYLAAIKEDTVVEVRVDAYPGVVFSGTIFAINPAIDRQTRSIAIRARVPNADMRLRPGMFARVTIPVDQNQATLLVPETALVPQGDKMLAYRVQGDKAQQIVVKMGRRSNGMAEVLEGLAEGDTVIVTGQMRVQDGGAVNVVNKIAPPAGPAITPAVVDVPPQSAMPQAAPAETMPAAPAPAEAQVTEGPALEAAPTTTPTLQPEGNPEGKTE